MAIVYRFDLYPRLNPVAGSRLVRFSQLQSAEYRGEANGTGSGKITLRGTSSDAAFIDPLGMQYVRVVRDNAGSELVVGGFFLETGNFDALTETSTKLLTFGGAGALSYLDRAALAFRSYDPGGAADQFIEPHDGAWHWYYSTIGSILFAQVEEAQQPTRPQQPISDLTMDFSFLYDSDSVAWPGYGDSLVLQADVGSSLLQLAAQLMEAGLYVSLDPDTFVLSAWMADGHGRDRTGGAWGSSVVRFQAPSAATVATGNIKSDAKRGIAALIKRSDLMIGSPTGVDLAGMTGYDWINDPTADLVWEGAYTVEDPVGDSLATIGAAQLAARSDASDTVRLRMKLGNSPTSGEYLPFEHVQLDDRVTLHTGSGAWDWNEVTQKVAAITLQLRTGGDWDAWVDLGSQYASIGSRQFQAGSGGCTCTPLCNALEVNRLIGLSGSSLKVSSTDGGNVKTNANDGDLAIASAVPHWSNAAANGVDEAYWAADMGGSRTVDMYRVRQGFTEPGVGTAPEGATEMKIYGSDSGTAWSWLPSGNLTADPAANGWTLVETISDGSTTGADSGYRPLAGTYRYWLLRASAGPAAGVGTGWNVQEFELWSDFHTGTDPRAARCDHHHSASDVDERNYGDVQTAIDTLSTSSGVTYGTPAIVLGTAAAAGSTDEAIRRDSTIIAFDATAPVTQAFSDAAATGSAAVAARRDHKHGMPAGSSATIATDTIWDAKGDLAAATAADTATKLTAGANATHLVARSAESTGLKWEAQTGALSIIIDGGGAVISTGVKVDIEIPFNLTFTGWTLLADQSGAIKIDLWADTYANYPPVDGDSITNAHEPEIAASGTSATDAAITDWSGEARTLGDTLRVNVDSVTSHRRVTLSLQYQRD